MVKAKKPLEDVALGLLARREHGVAELRRKLLLKGYDKADVVALVARLEASGAVNDARYAEARARSRAEGSKWGAMRIGLELQQGGVAKELVKATLADLDATHDWLASAKRALRGRFARPLVAPVGGDAAAWDLYKKEKAKRVGFLARKGFGMGQIAAALEVEVEDNDILL